MKPVRLGIDRAARLAGHSELGRLKSSLREVACAAGRGRKRTVVAAVGLRPTLECSPRSDPDACLAFEGPNGRRHQLALARRDGL